MLQLNSFIQCTKKKSIHDPKTTGIRFASHGTKGADAYNFFGRGKGIHMATRTRFGPHHGVACQAPFFFAFETLRELFIRVRLSAQVARLWDT